MLQSGTINTDTHRYTKPACFVSCSIYILYPEYVSQLESLLVQKATKMSSSKKFGFNRAICPRGLGQALKKQYFDLHGLNTRGTIAGESNLNGRFGGTIWNKSRGIKYGTNQMKTSAWESRVLPARPHCWPDIILNRLFKQILIWVARMEYLV